MKALPCIALLALATLFLPSALADGPIAECSNLYATDFVTAHYCYHESPRPPQCGIEVDGNAFGVGFGPRLLC
jgi:hypothetical protein